MNDNKTMVRSSDSATDLPERDETRIADIAIPGFSLGARLGQGGMASVYEGFDQGFNPPRRVAVKFMDPALHNDAEFRERFEREASIVAAFRHDSIVHVYASGEVDGRKYIVMEYLDGGTLSKRVDERSMSIGECIRIGAILANALAYSHTRGIVHRDFKPGNVLFTTDGKPILTDFGVAKSTTAIDSNLTRHAIVIGAPRYMSPEQKFSEPVSDRSDVYSFGVTLFEMITGKLPITRMRGEPQDMKTFATLLPDVPAPVAELIYRCLEIDPLRRPTAAECSQLLSTQTIDAKKTGTPWIKYAAAGVIVALGAIFLVVYTGDGPTPQTESAGKAADSATVTLARKPASARVLIDGTDVLGTSVKLSPGSHDLIAVAANYYGDMHRITVVKDTPVTVDFSLEPVKYPTVTELEKFFDLADAATLSAADVENTTEKSLQAALRSKLLRQTGQTGPLEVMQKELNTLASAGDSRASVALFLQESIRQGSINRSLINESLLAASSNGDGMASFFIAIATRDSIASSGAPATAANPEFVSYCRYLSLAGSQGWPTVVSSYQLRDQCTR